MTVTIREARRDDEARWRALWADYLAFYGVGISDDITDLTWRRVFDPASAIFMRVAVVDDVVMGFALCLTHEGTWTSGLDCYLEDLFVDAEVRGRGLGQALLDDLVALSKASGWTRLYWHTDETNSTARKLYDRFVQSDGHIRYRITL
ncbi:MULTISPECIES: GNAT family N-acetyltransferase [unclassified Rhizobium]|uniref:GNAT family N-acetyltransferase n=1 Tax=unclassified Rhizobium TaxID=2613769 RepID=UPI001ADB8FCC|nr:MULTISPECIES: GNAT family N-acetyltransferase [unclassified Rhizobium]MBO9096903.1 GNAT family N-acetyltransferase [Rhizobium sp. L58/93]MBO9134256.1 GNAT family N-acetyltransferase [Rhizobium sp. B209b/85]MBO9167142.1 GNAT family N-acetyltransferase [Rhizobium sp. L245/93]MBO9183100.1 GNAT family N-acetyltransferase [Rhizobium sp. E27B/91]QXZ83457.1 GNAT family N-acetyltransferase [Rhizobium sp. K1/93]